MDYPACVAVLGFGLTSEDPCEHDACGGPIASLGCSTVGGLLQELPNLLIHLIQVVAGVVGPDVDVRQLEWDIQGVLIAKPLDDGLIRLLIPILGVELSHQLACIKMHRHSSSDRISFLNITPLRRSNGGAGNHVRSHRESNHYAVH